MAMSSPPCQLIATTMADGNNGDTAVLIIDRAITARGGHWRPSASQMMILAKVDVDD